MLGARSHLLMAAVALLLAGCWNPSAKVAIRWETHGVPSTIEIYEFESRANLPVGTMATVQTDSDAPIGRKISEGILRLKRGQSKKFVLVYRNRTQEDVYFLAAPHTAQPAELRDSADFKCLCINYAFKIEPDRTWYRVAELHWPESEQAMPKELRHHLVAMSEQEALEHNQKAQPNGFAPQHRH